MRSDRDDDDAYDDDDNWQRQSQKHAGHIYGDVDTYVDAAPHVGA